MKNEGGNMKKSFLRYKMLFLTLLLVVAVLIPMQKFLVQARAVIAPMVVASADDGGLDEPVGEGESGESGTTPSSGETAVSMGNKVSTSTITDTALYEKLLKIYNDDNGTSYSDIYSKMFENYKIIDVSSSGISALSGLGYLKLSSLKTFKADLNNISSFDETCFSTTTSQFETLSLSGNKIASFKVSQLTQLHDINLSGNKLTTLDFSCIEGAGSLDGNRTFSLNVAGNLFKSMSSITLPSRRIEHININIINNQIVEIPSEYFTEKYTISAGIQGFSTLNEKFVTDTKRNVTVYRTNNENLRVEIWKIDGEEDVLVTSIADNNTAGADIYFQENELSKTLSLEVGEYEYRYMIGEDNAYNIEDSDTCYLKSNRFSVIPQKPAYVFVYKDKEYKTLNKVTGVVTVKLTGEEGATLMYQINNGEWKEGTIIECANGGTYSIKLKSIVGDMESDVEAILVRTSLNLYIPDGLMFVLVLLLALVLFLIVLPIISKKYFKKD